MKKQNHTSHLTLHTSQKGITLIALIITIIVMLILVGVTINVALNGGLFQKAEQATKETEQKAILEEMLAMMEIDNNGKFKPDEIIGNMRTKHPEYEIIYNKPNATITGKLGTYNYIVSETEIKIGESAPLAFDWKSVGLEVDINTEYIPEEGPAVMFLKEGVLLILKNGSEFGKIDATKSENIKDGKLNFSVNEIFGMQCRVKIEMNENKTDIDFNVIYIEEDGTEGNSEAIVCKKVIVDSEKVYTNEEVLKKLGITNYTGTYKGTWTVIGTENGKTKLVSTIPVVQYTLGYEDPRAIEAIPAIDESAPTEIEKLERAIWSYRNAETSLNLAAEKATGIKEETVKARSINLKDIELLTNITKGPDYDKNNYTYNYTTHRDQRFVNENNDIIILDSEGEEITLQSTYYSYRLTENEIGNLANWNYWLVTPCVKCLSGYAQYMIQYMHEGYFRYAMNYCIFSSNDLDGGLFSVTEGVRAVVYI